MVISFRARWIPALALVAYGCAENSTGPSTEPGRTSPPKDLAPSASAGGDEAAADGAQDAAGDPGGHAVGDAASDRGCALDDDPECGAPADEEEERPASPESCETLDCGDHGWCLEGLGGVVGCACEIGFRGPTCDACADPALAYPDCATPEDEAGVDDEGADAEEGEEGGADGEAGADGEGGPGDGDQGDPPDEAECQPGAEPGPEVRCQGVCALAAPTCEDGRWVCDGPGHTAGEFLCDGFDNDCDGEVDEACPRCDVAEDAIRGELYSIWDIDFDYACTTYLTSLISGADYSVMIPANGAPPTRYFGNANQNMGFAAFDPASVVPRAVTVYSCCESCGCQATNGVTLLDTCDPALESCLCEAQANCPGYLNDPFLPAGRRDLPLQHNGMRLTTPTGLAAGPGGLWFVGNYKPLECAPAGQECDACDPAHPDVWCSTARPNCCDDRPEGQLVQFTLPTVDLAPTWRVVHRFEGEAIIALASGRDGAVIAGTVVLDEPGAPGDPGSGSLYRYDPVNRRVERVTRFAAAARSATQDRRNGDWYVEVDNSPRLRRFSETFEPRELPAGVPADPAGQGALQYSPDGRLYRVVGSTDGLSPMGIFDLD